MLANFLGILPILTPPLCALVFTEPELPPGRELLYRAVILLHLMVA
jgi:hypothetical protein